MRTDISPADVVGLISSLAIGQRSQMASADEIKLKSANVLQMESNVGFKERGRAISIRCPHCRHVGTFETIGRQVTFSKGAYNLRSSNLVMQFTAAMRTCPNPNCKGLVFVVEKDGQTENDRQIEVCLPPEVIDFNADGLGENYLSVLGEAVKCHAAGAHRAAAMMVRRLLEEICEQEGAEGQSLHHRLEALKSKVTLPQELFDAMLELKALGNDAAHIEAKAYDNIGADEAADSIELAKEILKSLYQLKGLVARLKARKNTTS
ncbi:MAG: DUF4145 domain-containing protein [Hyphomicrobiales bacterium]